MNDKEILKIYMKDLKIPFISSIVDTKDIALEDYFQMLEQLIGTYYEKEDNNKETKSNKEKIKK